MFRQDWVKHLQDLKVYIHQEQDHGGEVMIKKVITTLKDAGFMGDVYKFTCGNIPECKDPSDVYVKFGKDDGGQKIMSLKIGRASCRERV